MPNVGGKKFAYNERGMAAAAAERRKQAIKKPSPKAPGGNMFRRDPLLQLNESAKKMRPAQPRLKEGQVRRRVLTANPPIIVTERYSGGQWTEIGRARVDKPSMKNPYPGGRKPGRVKPQQQIS
jgi:hypothetical protein